MSQSENTRQFYAETYDVSVPDWPGELDFYRSLVDQVVNANRGAILEIACGTGRVAIRLAQSGANVVGLDHSPEMLEVARQKSIDLQTMRWIEADMRSFELAETFGLVIIPGHAFQNLNTPEDQAACLVCIKRHLNPGGLLVVHLDHMNDHNVRWLGDLCEEKGGVFKAAEQFRHPTTGRPVRTSRAWSYEPATQTAIVQTIWEEIEADEQIVGRWESGPIRLHCVFRFEMEHLLRRVGFEIDAVYGDFFRQALQDESSDLIWVASKGQRHE
jgi:ubiquinone/menaquinone biosynthesis C-methylase UbiE